jgi:hypothetical protein
MSIQPISGDGAASAADPNRAEAQERPGGSASPTVGKRVARSDQVEISSEGRLLAELAELADEIGLDAGTLRTIQQRLAGGFYQRSDTLDEVAMKLLSSGDLGALPPGETP